MGNHPVAREPDRYLRWGAFKAHFDGLMGSHGALLYEPYSDRQTTSGRYRQCTSSSPLLREPDMEKFDRLLQLVAEAQPRGEGDCEAYGRDRGGSSAGRHPPA